MDTTALTMSMFDPTVPHPEYSSNNDRWIRCSDAYEGQDAIKVAGAKYLPKLAGQTDPEYRSYRDRALYYNVMERTVAGLAGAAVLKEFEYKLPAAIECMMEAATCDNISLQQFTKRIVEEILKFGRCGLLVDRDEDDSATELPYLALYNASSVINWEFDDDKALMVMIQEQILTPDPKNPYKSGYVTQWRELTLDKNVYIQRIWQRITNEAGLIQYGYIESVMLSRGQKMDYIPFVFVNATGISSHICRPPLLSLVDVAISHYHNSADLEHGRHFTGLPTPWVTGISTKPGEQLKIGSQTAWTIPNENAKIGYLEFSGDGLQTLERALEAKQLMMTILGARLLESQKAAAETEGAMRIRNMGDTFTLSGINIAVADGLALCLDFASLWQGGAAEVTVTPNITFAEEKLGALEITALLGALNSNAISLDTFLWNMKSGERLPPTIDVEDEKAAVAEALDGAMDAIKDTIPKQATPPFVDPYSYAA
jgi:hypothetical protein